MPDFLEERAILTQDVYPKLRDYCKQRYGLEFQVRTPKLQSHESSCVCQNINPNMIACPPVAIGFFKTKPLPVQNNQPRFLPVK